MEGTESEKLMRKEKEKTFIRKQRYMFQSMRELIVYHYLASPILKDFFSHFVFQSKQQNIREVCACVCGGGMKVGDLSS